MSAEIIEALYGGGSSCHQGFEYILGFLKLADLASDILFINTMSKFDTHFADAVLLEDGSRAVNWKLVIGVSIFFTVVGFGFDFFKAKQLLQVYREHNNFTWKEIIMDVFFPSALKKFFYGDENNGRKKAELNQRLKKKTRQQACWWRLNVLFEELPQFFILAIVAGSLNDSNLNCEIEETCNQKQTDYFKDLKRDGIISMVFTLLSLIVAVAFYLRLLFRRCCCKSAEEGEGEDDSKSAEKGEGEDGGRLADEAGLP